VLKILGISRSTYYYRKHYRVEEKKVSGGRPAPGYSYHKKGNKISDEQIKEMILEELEGDAYNYGYRKITAVLRYKYDLIINEKKVYRLCKELDVLRTQREIKAKYPRELARNHTITRSNQLWEIDIKYGYIVGEDRFFFVCSIIDVYDRNAIDYPMGLSCLAEDVVRTVKRALFKRQLFDDKNMPIIRTDNGPQFISHTFEEFCEEQKIVHERIPPKTPNMNAHIESFHRIFEDDCLSQWEFKNDQEAYQAVYQFMEFYNNRRIHSSLKYLAPMAFYEKNLKQPINIKEVRV